MLIGTFPGGGYFLNGTMSEMLFYNQVLSTSQRQTVEGYLAWKWNLTRSFSVVHPYYSFQPSVAPSGPSLIAGLQLWLDGADPAGTGVKPASGATVATWVDKSGMGNTTTSVTGTITYNTTNGMVFNGASFFNLPDNSLPYNNSSYSYYIVCRVISGTGFKGLLGGGTGSSNSEFTMIANNNETIQVSWFGNEITSPNTFTKGINGPSFIVSTTYQSGANRTLVLNGTSGATDTPGTRTQGNTGNKIGAQRVGLLSSLNGYISEVLVYNTGHTTTQRQTIEGYLATKWNLQSSLPVSHPYYSLTYTGVVPSWTPLATLAGPTGPAGPSSNLVQTPIQYLTSGTLGPTVASGYTGIAGPTGSYYINSAAGTLNKRGPIPAGIPGLQLWLDGADPLATGTAPPIGTVISTWYDKSGNNNHGIGYGLEANNNFNQNAYTTPVYASNGVVFNGKEYYRTPYTAASPSETAFIVLTYATGPNSNYDQFIIHGEFNSTQSVRQFAFSAGVNLQIAGFSRNPSPVVGTRYLFSYQYNSRSLVGMSINGTFNAASGQTLGALTAGTTTVIGNFMRDGAPDLIGSALFGTISEIIIYNQSLSTANRELIEGYLQAKWGMFGTTTSIGLTGTHPFNSAFAPPNESVQGWSAVANINSAMTIGPTVPTATANAVIGNYYLHNSTGALYQYCEQFAPYPLNSLTSGIQLWLDGADPAGTGVKPANGATVATWVDKSGNGYNATGGVSPTYNTALGLVFNGSTQYLRLANGAIPFGDSNYSIYIVARFTNSSGGGAVLFAGANNNGILFMQSTGSMFRSDWAGSEGYNNLAFTLNQSFVTSSVYNNATPRTRSTNLNASSITISPNVARTQPNTGNFVGAFSVDGSNPAGGTLMEGYISEIIVYNVAHGTSQRQANESYLAWKWGLNNNLSTVHPYYASPYISRADYKWNNVYNFNAYSVNGGTNPWSGTVPTNFTDAINRLAIKVSTVGAGNF